LILVVREGLEPSPRHYECRVRNIFWCFLRYKLIIHHHEVHPAIVEAVRSDPRGFLDSLKLPVILDEIQNAPELLNYIRARIDLKKGRKGQWLLTGSQDFALMHGVTESMAGRAAVLHLLPLSTVETAKVTLLQGGYPEILARPRDSDLWFQSYLQTYLERDVRQISQIRELATFRRFLALIARCIVVHKPTVQDEDDTALAVGARAMSITGLLHALRGSRK
jgi:uncharacterized protein